MNFIFQDEQKSIITGIEGDQKNITIPSNAVKLETHFLDQKTTEFVYFEKGSLLKTLGVTCFSEMNTLISVDFSNCLELPCLSYRCFFRCSSLVECILPKNGKFETLSVGSFTFCSLLKSFSFPSTCRVFQNTTELNTAVFEGCSSMTNIYFPIDSKLENIGSYGFISCASLTELRIPLSIRRIEQYAFLYCYSLKILSISSNAKICSDTFTEIEKFEQVFYAYSSTKRLLIFYRFNLSQAVWINIPRVSCNIRSSHHSNYIIRISLIIYHSSL